MTYEEQIKRLNPVEAEYRRRMSALSPAERLARGFAMSQMVYDHLKRQILEKNPGISKDSLFRELALALYPNDEGVQKLLGNTDDRLR